MGYRILSIQLKYEKAHIDWPNGIGEISKNKNKSIFSKFKMAAKGTVIHGIKQQNKRDYRPTPRNAPMKFHQNRSILRPVIVLKSGKSTFVTPGENTGGRGPKNT